VAQAGYEGIHTLYNSPSIARVMEESRLIWAKKVTRLREARIALTF
jgi:hypothetical protein